MGGRKISCGQCHATDVSLYRDRNDNRTYCCVCWKKYYNRKAPDSALVDPDGNLVKPSKKGRVSPKPGGPKPGALAAQALGKHPISPATVPVDTYYEGAERSGRPSVFSEAGIAWSVMLKGPVIADPHFCAMQLIVHDTDHIIFTRQGAIGGDFEELYEEFQTIKEAKERFASVFEEKTANPWHVVSRNILAFVGKKENFTIPADTRAARREENNVNRETREAQRREVEEQRNTAVTSTARSLLGAPAAAPKKSPAQGAASPMAEAKPKKVEQKPKKGKEERGAKKGSQAANSDSSTLIALGIVVASVVVASVVAAKLLR